MNIVQAGATLRVYGEDVKTYKELPKGSYTICFDKMSGFYLRQSNNLAVNETKIYGNTESKVDKVLKSYQIANRNLGVILSGQKGIGKSLFARVLANKSEYPIITVSIAVPGIANFISSIEQEVIIIFDEFEKNFCKQDDWDPQVELLPLFDGIDGGKKLFIVTCNNVNGLNEFLVNRPGRFHYHFVLSNPTDEEVTEYLIDKLNPQYYDVIERIVKFASAINVTYDYLRAIVFEINQGYSVEETFSDLNITKSNNIRFNITVTLNNGFKYAATRYIDLFSSTETCIDVYPATGPNYRAYPAADITFDSKDVIRKDDGTFTVEPDKVVFSFYADDEDEENVIKDLKVKEIILKKEDVSDLRRFVI